MIINKGLFFWGFFLLSFIVLSQEDSRVDLSFKDLSLEETLTEIQESTKSRIFFDTKWTENKKVNIELRNVTAEEALIKILENHELKFIFRHPNFFILFPNPNSSNTPLFADQDNNDTISIGGINLMLDEATLSGYIVNGENNTPLNGTVITVNSGEYRFLSNPNGSYEMSLPIGNYEISFHHPSMTDFNIFIALNSNGQLNVNMFEDVLRLEEVVISEQAIDQNISKTLSGNEIITTSTIKTIPSLFGEADVLNSLLSLPGVSKTGEGSAGLNVRGGGVGQNLITLDQSTIYNPNHLFGFFSSFNADAISKVNFYRGSTPVEYGGRLSSILDVSLASGNKKEFAGKGGVGFVNSRIMVEGPIKKDTSSFSAAVRAAYPSYLVKSYEDRDLRQSAAFFGDASLKFDHLINIENRLTVSGYLSRDKFSFSDQAKYEYGNQALSMEWNRQLSQNTFTKTSGTFSSYEYDLSEVSDPQFATNLNAGIQELSVENKTQTEKENQTLTYGLSFKKQLLNPGQYNPDSEVSVVEPLKIDEENGITGALFFGDELNMNDQISFYAGLRYSFFFSKKRNSNQVYHGPEPRFFVKYNTSPTSSVKLGYSRMRQYLHLISNTASVTPFDMWQLSNTSIKPSIADQVSLGYFRNFKNNSLETSVEFYYKNIIDLIDYKNGAQLSLNPDVEEELIQGKGKAYGLEFLMKKKSGDLNGWISYTWSRSLIKVIDSNPQNTINNGAFFPTNFDQPHNFTAFSNLEVSRRFSINTQFTFNTGRPVTYPESVYEVRDVTIVDFNERNKYRIPDYHRLDITFVLSTSLRREKMIEANWSFTIFNVYGRENIYSVYYKNNPTTGDVESYSLSVIARPILAISYNFKF